MHSFSDLPVDVARHILEIAAVQDRELTYHLVYVSKVVREWIDPILYHAVNLIDRTAQDVFLESCNRRRMRGDADFYARNVKSFAACPRRLSLAFGVSSPFECTTPSLTHLHIYDPLRLGVEHRIDWKALVQFCPKLTHILLDVDSEHVEDWDDELLGEVTVNRFRDILHVVPPTFKALIFEVLESKNDSWVNDVRREDEYSGLALMSQAEGFDVAAANLVHVISDNQFVFRAQQPLCVRQRSG
ncbi:hypothetical protein CPB85DRAFT_1446736 [Mucidula mucida]|nr:hypothetical protein CPB85DRAFT_1446736 [Mucidula mucida]